MNNKIKSILCVLMLAFVLVGCANVSTKPDEVAIAYTGGPIQGTSFNKIVQPGSGVVWLGIADASFTYPTTQRDYTASNDTGDSPDGSAITCPTKDGVASEWSVVTFFKLNTSKIRTFHESIGLKFHAYNGGKYTNPNGTESNGWDAMLGVQFRQQLENTIQRVCRSHSSDEIHRDAGVYGKLNDEIAKGLKDQINTALGDAYFCGPTFNGKIEENGNADCPDFQVVVKKAKLTDENVIKSYNDQKTSENGKVTAENAGQNKIIEAQRAADAAIADAEGKQKAQEKLAAIYNDPAYIAYLKALAQQRCAENTNCTLVITNGDNGGVNVNVAANK